MVSKSQAGLLTRPAGPWVMWPGAAGPCYSGSRCFMGISVGLALVEGLPAAGWATWVPDRSMWAPSVERGAVVSKSQAGLLARPAGPWVMWPGAAGPSPAGLSDRSRRPSTLGPDALR